MWVELDIAYAAIEIVTREKVMWQWSSRSECGMDRDIGRNVVECCTTEEAEGRGLQNNDHANNGVWCRNVGYSEVIMLVSHCGEYPCECKKYIFAANSPDSGEYMANGLTNAIRRQSQ